MHASVTSASDDIVLSKSHGLRKNHMIRRTTRARVLDIGFGRGGDMWNFAHAHALHIDGIEPDVHNREQGELRLNQNISRLQSQGFQTSFRYIAARGEDTPEVLRQIHANNHNWTPYDFVTSFFSMTFFFRDRDMLLGMLRTVQSCLKENGVFMGIMLDGGEVRRTLLQMHSNKAIEVQTEVFTLTPQFESTSAVVVAKPNKGDPTRSYGNKVHIHFHSTKAIVKEQTEYLTDFTTLVDAAASFNLTLISHALLTPDPRIRDERVRSFSAAHRMFAFKRTSVQLV